MPSPNEILAQLTLIANRAAPVAIAWHLALLAVLIAVARGWRPPRRAARRAIAGLLASVAAFALAFGNVFNGALFALGAVALVALAGGPGARRPLARGAAWQRWVGAAMLAYGWVYPHFLEAPWPVYLYAAPVGLVPCPTLSVAIGLALLGGLGTGGWGAALSALGLSYGIFGVARLGVVLDLGLTAGALALAASAIASLVPHWLRGRPRRTHPLRAGRRPPPRRRAA